MVASEQGETIIFPNRGRYSRGCHRGDVLTGYAYNHPGEGRINSSAIVSITYDSGQPPGRNENTVFVVGPTGGRSALQTTFQQTGVNGERREKPRRIAFTFVASNQNEPWFQPTSGCLQGALRGDELFVHALGWCNPYFTGTAEGLKHPREKQGIQSIAYSNAQL